VHRSIYTALSKDEILQNHRSVSDTFNIPFNGMNEFALQCHTSTGFLNFTKNNANIDTYLDPANASSNLYPCSSPTY
jgi:hypothetical protein